MATDKMDVAAA